MRDGSLNGYVVLIVENITMSSNVWEGSPLILAYMNTKIYSEIANNITGEMLLECDHSVLKEMGISKVGDRVRIFVAVKALRSKAYGSPSRSRVMIPSIVFFLLVLTMHHRTRLHHLIN